MDELNEFSCAITEYIKEHSDKSVFDLWFRDIKLLSLNLDEKKAVFGTNNVIKQKFILTKYLSFLTDAVKAIFDTEFDISISVTNEPVKPESFIENRVKVETPKPQSITDTISDPQIISKYNFENFIVGESNKFAESACYAVATSNEIIYNPLFIYGTSGIGKTHLLCAITNEIKKRNPFSKILYTKGDDFTNEFLNALKDGTTTKFREKYCSLDVLLIDDIQFIAGKMSTQEEFFNTFAKLYESEKQIILTSDRPPKDINLLEERLRTRFEWGLIADIQPPSYELRTAIIKKKAEELGLTLSNELTEFLADKLQNNIRQIEGAIKKIALVSQLTASPVTLDMCQRCVADFISGTIPPSIMCDKILTEVAKHYNTTVDDIKSNKRNSNIVIARQISVYLMRKLTAMNLANIGALLNRDHSTVISSLKKIEEEMQQSKSLEAEISELINKVKS